MFDENSGLVKIWLRLLSQRSGEYSLEDVPDIDNLKDVVIALYSESEK